MGKGKNKIAGMIGGAIGSIAGAISPWILTCCNNMRHFTLIGAAIGGVVGFIVASLIAKPKDRQEN